MLQNRVQNARIHFLLSAPTAGTFRLNSKLTSTFDRDDQEVCRITVFTFPFRVFRCKVCIDAKAKKHLCIGKRLHEAQKG